MSGTPCKNCEALENITSTKLNWFNLLSAENISLHESLASSREQIRVLNLKVSNLQKSSFDDQQEIIRLYIGKELLKKQLSGKQHDKTPSPMIEYHKNIKNEYYNLIESDVNLSNDKRELHITQQQDHIKILIEELKICRRDLMSQCKRQLNEQCSLRELLDREKLKSEVNLNNLTRESEDLAQFKIQMKFDSLLKYKEEQLRKQDAVISVLKKQQETVYSQLQKLSQNKDNMEIDYKEINNKLKKDLEKLRLKYEKLERRRSLEVEGYQTQIKFLNKN